MSNHYKLPDDILFEQFRKIILEYPDISADKYDKLQVPNKPPRTTLRRRFGEWQNIKAMALGGGDVEIIVENVRLAKQKQRFEDRNRIERKSFRQYCRIENAVVELNKKFIDLLEHNSLKRFVKHFKPSKPIDENAVGLLHFTDAHFNELVELANNRYDFVIASKRCKKLVRKAKQYFKLFNIKNILFAMTGDLINSDRRLDELLSQATNRSKAMFLSVEIIQQMLLDLNSDFNVTVACVTGNESRIPNDIAWTDIVVTDNYDFSIFNILRYLFKDCKGIDFNIGDSYSEQVISVAGQNVLLIHGNQISTKIEESIQKIKGKWAAKGVIVDFVICGNVHSCRIGDTYARGSSVVGANAYSEEGLQLTSRASQNIHIFFPDKTRDSIRIDLQDVSGEEGYDISRELEEYCAKSAEKLHKPITIFKIQI